METGKVKAVYLKEGNRIIRCRICGEKIEKGRRYPKEKTDGSPSEEETYVYRPHALQPIELQPIEDEHGEYKHRFIHSECSHISFGDVRRAKANGVSVAELLGGICAPK